MNLDRITLMKPGKYSTTGGTPLNITADDLANLASAYDPAVFEAPIIAGDPKHDDPAYGWIKGLVVEDGALQAIPHHVNPTFGEAIATGKFQKRAVSIFSPDATSNPTPGRPYLRHIGFKGIIAPPVPGLRPVNFASVRGCLLFELEPSALHFAAAPGYSPSAEGLADLKAAKAYADRHGCTLLDAVAALALGTPEFAAPLPSGFTVTQKSIEALDRARAYAREHGCSLLLAYKELSMSKGDAR